MIEIYTQIPQNHYNHLDIVSQEYVDMIKQYKPNQMLRTELYGTLKARSVLQNRWIHAIFRHVASNTEHPDWDTPEKAKRKVKMAMNFFKDEVIVDGNKVYFELRSFAFDKMDQHEANVKYEEAKNHCARFLKVKPEDLESQAINE
jgi:hypothetical protein